VAQKYVDLGLLLLNKNSLAYDDDDDNLLECSLSS